MTPLTSLDWIFSPISYLAMTHNLCVECESAFVPVCIWVHVRWGGWEREWALMQCFPTLPLPPPPLPSSSSLLCTVDDSDPGQSSETWGERLVPPCRIYAGNRCSSIPAPVSSTSHVTHFAPLCCCKHTCTCVCFHSAWWWGGGGLEKCCLHLAGLRECCLFLSLFQTSCLSSVSPRADTREGGKRCHCYDEIATQSENVLLVKYFLVLLQIKMDQTRRRWKRRLGARNPRPTFCLGTLCQSANRWLSLCRWLPTVQVCVPALWKIVHQWD